MIRRILAEVTEAAGLLACFLIALVVIFWPVLLVVNA
jgi:hypothetical protein